jgi:hypothetical protein
MRIPNSRQAFYMAPTELPVCTSLAAIIRPSADDDMGNKWRNQVSMVWGSE